MADTPLSSTRGRVLIAEDDPENGRLLGRLLTHRGFSAEVVADGLDALERALGGDWDLVLTDIQMPRLDGVELARRIRAHEATSATGPARLPILAVTAHALDAFRDGARAAGMDGFLEKPIDLGALDAATASFSPGRARTLLLEPDAGRRKRLARLLSAPGRFVFAAAHPSEVRRARRFDVVVLGRGVDRAFGKHGAMRGARRIALGPHAEESGVETCVAEDGREEAALLAAVSDAESAQRDAEGASSAPSRASEHAVEVDTALLELVPAFLERRRRELEPLRGHLVARQWSAILRLGHGIAATASGFGFEHLAAVGRAIERAARDEAADRAEAAVAALADHLESIEVLERR